MKNLLYINLFTLIFSTFFYAVDQSRLAQLKSQAQGRNVPQHSPGSQQGPAGNAPHPVAHTPVQVVPEVAHPVVAPQVVQPAVVAPAAPVLQPQVIENVIPTPSPTPIIMSGSETSNNELVAVQKKVQEIENALNIFKTETTANVGSLQQSLNALRQTANAGSAQTEKSELEKLKLQLVKIDQEINAMKKNFATFSGIKK
jgi:hypothetical protein